jgi:hypothetical protein
VKELLSNLPRDVLFVLRTNALVRSLNAELGTQPGIRFRIFGSSAVVGMSIPPSTKPPDHAYFLDDVRDYTVVVPKEAGGGRVLQRRRKADFLNKADAGVNQPTASEAFLFSGERRPLAKEVMRQVRALGGPGTAVAQSVKHGV